MVVVSAQILAVDANIIEVNRFAVSAFPTLLAFLAGMLWPCIFSDLRRFLDGQYSSLFLSSCV
jgi:hypothetical protein